MSPTVLKAVLDYAPIGIWLQDPSGRLLLVNRTFCDAVGIAEERFLAVPHYAELYDEATARNCMASDREALARDGPHTSWEKVRFVDGQLHEIEIVKLRLSGPDGQPEGLIGLSMDVTERRRAEAALGEAMSRLRERESQLAAIIDSAMDAIITVDERQRIVVFNRAAEQVFRCPASEALGTQLERFLPERHRAAHREHVERFGRSGTTSRSHGSLGRIAALRADGEEFPCEASISRVKVDGRRLLTVILRDVTERLRAEAASRELEGQVRQAQKMEALGTLAGGIAHDFNNVLGVMLANAELAATAVAGHPDAEESLAAILAAGQRARALVRRILAFSRKEALERTPMDLRPTLDEAARFLRAALIAGVDLRTSFADDAPPVRADGTEIHQIVINLCTNAWHALEEGRGHVELRLEGVRVTAAEAASNPALRAGPYAVLSVSDTGCGMDAATRERIFEPFFTTKEAGRGTGLGLSVVRAIVRQMGGAIDVRSQPGQGTVFRVFLPAADPAERVPAAGEPPPVARPGRGERVLYVDGEAQMAETAARILERAGFEVAAFTRPEDALAAVQAAPDRFDVAVADANTPGMSGVDLARELRRVRPSLRLGLTTGHRTQALEDEATALGVVRILEKPYSTAELREAVASMVRGGGR